LLAAMLPNIEPGETAPAPVPAIDDAIANETAAWR
jgi:hypothetical protein